MCIRDRAISKKVSKKAVLRNKLRRLLQDWLFKKFGQIIAKDSDEDKLLELLISTGIEDLESLENGRTLINMEVENLSAVKEVLDSETIEIEESELVMNASVNVELDEETSEKVIKLLENLDDLDDVQNVHSNAEFVDNL